MTKLGFGGGCHWCTEAVFKAIKNVHFVEQGWISSEPPFHSFSEAVIVHFDPDEIQLKTLISIHLKTHSSSSNHSMREKYRSAIYVFNNEQKEKCKSILNELQKEFATPLVTRVLLFNDFKLNQENFLNFHEKNPNHTFCERYINPKFELLKKNFPNNLK